MASIGGLAMKRWGMLAIGLALLWGTAARAADTVYYYYTDEQGTPEVMADAQGNVIERTQYAPYGQVLNRPEHDGPGYTGHEEDAATGLTNMQQRYAWKVIGRMISTDPVGVDPNTGANFNKYAYASDNPYRFVDPDGRQDCVSSGCKDTEEKPTPTTGCLTTGCDSSANVSVTVVDESYRRGLASGSNSAGTSRPSSSIGNQGAQTASQQNQSDDPSKLVIENLNGENHGSYSEFTYQLENANSQPLTGDGYSLEEHVTPDEGRGANSNNIFVPMMNGQAIDRVGWKTPKLPTIYQDRIYTQTFRVMYKGVIYPLTTELGHESMFYNGNYANTIWVIKP